MENPFKNLFFGHEKQKNHYQEIVDNIKKNALDVAAFRDIRQKEVDYSLKETFQNLTEVEKQEHDQLEEILSLSSIKLTTDVELSDLLRTMHLKSADIDRLIQHERSHASAAIKNGAIMKGYECLIYKDPASPSGYAFDVTTIIELPKEWKEIDKKEVLKEIVEAPENSEGELSLGDKEILGKI